MSIKLERYKKYSREEVNKIFDEGTKFTTGSGRWGGSGIVRIPNAKSDYVFFVTFGSKQGSHEFEESIDENGILIWQSQPSQNLREKRIKDFIKHDYEKNNIYLFLRTNNHDKYTYLGLLAYIDHDNERENPVYFKWQILDWDEDKAKEALDNLKISKSDLTIKNNKNKRSGLIEQKEIGEYTLHKRTGKATRDFNTNRNRDFINEAKKNTKLGNKGEDAVVKFEKDRLIKEGRADLAKDVNATRETIGNTAKFDVLSYEVDGTERYIEVKTTKSGLHTKFHISEAEVQFSIDNKDKYYLYRVYNFDEETMSGDVKIKKGEIIRKRLEPVNYMYQI